MIDLKDLRDNPQKYAEGARRKHADSVDISKLLELDESVRQLQSKQQALAAEKNAIGKQIGQVAGRMKKASDEEKTELSAQMKALQARPNEIKSEEATVTAELDQLLPQRDDMLLHIPQPPDADVPDGTSSDDNIEISTWAPGHFDPEKSFEDNKGFTPLSHMELLEKHDLVDTPRGVKIAGSRSYILKGAGMLLHQAILQYAFQHMVLKNGFTPMSVPVMVRDHMMVGTGFYPHGRDQAYAIGNPTTEGEDFSLTGTGEVGLMGLHADEILDHEQLPLTYTTVSTCFRREAGAAGKDTAGLYRIHQFDKVEQVVICEADEQVSRDWHKKMIGFVEGLLQSLELPYRLLQCCAGDLGPKNADMVDIECWMPSRGEGGEYGETHSASRLYDFQCRRLKTRYRDPETGKPVICHSLNNTVAASPRILIPILEIYQNEDGSITIPEALRPYMGGMEKIG